VVSADTLHGVHSDATRDVDVEGLVAAHHLVVRHEFAHVYLMVEEPADMRKFLEDVERFGPSQELRGVEAVDVLAGQYVGIHLIQE
jgi:hypothetical protein